MRPSSIFHAAFTLTAAAALTATSAATPLAAQNTAPPPNAQTEAHLPADSIAAFARIALAVAQLRDSAQKQLSLPRNKTPQMQQQLRDQLAAQVAEVLKQAGMSAEEFRHRTFLVSTDSAARTVYDQTIAKLTGAPLPGQVAVAAAAVKVPAGLVGEHLGHIVNAFGDTPRGLGLLPVAMTEARTAATHAELAARDPQNLEAMKQHVAHVAHAIDPTASPSGPGLGYGVKRAALGMATHVDLAAKAPGASPNVTMFANHIGTSARNTVRRADEIIALTKRVQAAGSAAEASPLVSQLVALATELVDGKDADADGHVTWKEGEGGLAQCDEQMKQLLTAETSAPR